MGATIVAVKELNEVLKKLQTETCGMRDDARKLPSLHDATCDYFDRVVGLPPLSGSNPFSQGGGTAVHRDNQGQIEHVGGQIQPTGVSIFAGMQLVVRRCKNARDPGA